MGFFSAFTGSAQRKDISKANAQSNQALDSGYQNALTGYDKASSRYDPYAQSGGAANTFYNNALGLNGDTARNTAESTITSDPLWSGKLGQDQNRILAYQNARGDAGGGRAYAAGQQSLYDNYNTALNRYQQQGQQGLQAAGAQAGVDTGRGDLSYGYGATKAGNAINYGNALAQSRGIGVNNLLQLGGLGVKAFGAFGGGGGMPGIRIPGNPAGL